jgi:hypothetical protein
VDHKNEQQSDFNDRNEGVSFERVRVRVEDGRSEEDHQVTGDVDEEIEEESDAGNPDHEFRADRRPEHP